jgi:hypothetical protein
MFGIKIQDLKQSSSGGSSRSFDLRDILRLIGKPVLSSRWRCHDLWYTAVRDGKFDEIREARRKLSGEEMMQFAASIHQTIDGRFEARGGGAAKKPWVIILAVDSSWFEVWSSKREVIEKVRAGFEKVSNLPTGAA